MGKTYPARRAQAWRTAPTRTLSGSPPRDPLRGRRATSRTRFRGGTARRRHYTWCPVSLWRKRSALCCGHADSPQPGQGRRHGAAQVEDEIRVADDLAEGPGGQHGRVGGRGGDLGEGVDDAPDENQAGQDLQRGGRDGRPHDAWARCVRQSVPSVDSPLQGPDAVVGELATHQRRRAQPRPPRPSASISQTPLPRRTRAPSPPEAPAAAPAPGSTPTAAPTQSCTRSGSSFWATGGPSWRLVWRARVSCGCGRRVGAGRVESGGAGLPRFSQSCGVVEVSFV